MPRIRRTAPGRVLVLALALLGASLGGDHSTAPAPGAGAGTPPPGLVAAASQASGGLLEIIESSGVDVNYCTVCAAAGSGMQQTV